MKVIIIGGGASGFAAAITAKRKNHDVTILEKNPQFLKKLKITGNGRCNYYNDDQSLYHYNSQNNELISSIINDKNLEKVSTFFDSLGIIPKISNGYYYPFSNQAISICSSLILEAKSLGVVLKEEVEVKKIEKEENFKVITTKGIYEADKIIIATGGKSYEKTGSNGFGYQELKRLGHNINPLLPGLTSLIISNPKKDWKGVRTEAALKLLEDNKVIREEKGEVQLTEDGISGICTMQLSSAISKGLYLDKTESIEINFMPFLQEDFIKFMDDRAKLMKNRTIIELLEGILNYKLIKTLLKQEENLTWNECTSKEKETIKNKLLSYVVQVKNTKSFDHAQITLGGVSLLDIKLETMESAKIKGLYIVGELLDLSGDCGGYNLTIAWITGIKAGESL